MEPRAMTTSMFRDTRNQSLSGQMVMLSDLIPSTDYRVIVTVINTAGYRNSSDPVIGTTLTGKLQFTLLSLHSPSLNFSLLQPSHTSTLQPTPPSSQFLCLLTVLVLLSIYHSTSSYPHPFTSPTYPSPHQLLNSSPPHLPPQLPQLPWIL